MHDHENPYAGQGPVLLDIGGDIGALVVETPAELGGLEVEIRPEGATADEREGRPTGRHHPHVAVVARRAGERVVHSLVFRDVRAGRYELYALPDGPVVLRAEVHGGQVTHSSWPVPSGRLSVSGRRGRRADAI